MSIRDNSAIESRLASALDRRDETPNIELAEQICAQGDVSSVEQLCALLKSGTRAVQNDAIKVLYEIGARAPNLIAPHLPVFLEQMVSKNNRMVWGALTALAAISTVKPQPIFENFEKILDAADNGSVIAKDQAMQILINLKSNGQTQNQVTPTILARLQTAAINQLPMYAERIASVLTADDIKSFHEVLHQRLTEDMPSSKRKRIEKVLKIKA